MDSRSEEWRVIKPWHQGVDCPAWDDGAQVQPQPGCGAGEEVGGDGWLGEGEDQHETGGEEKQGG